MNLGATELILILVIVVVLFGPSRLPGLGKSIGEAIRGFKKGMGDDSRDVTESTRTENLNKAASSVEDMKAAQKEESKRS
jgi:sec-independent protein translocase protein TatA